MVSDNKKRKAKTKVKVFTTEDLMKCLYILLNTVGGKSQVATIPTRSLEEMPPDWKDRIGMRELPDMKVCQVFLKPREDEEESVIITPKQKRIITHG